MKFCFPQTALLELLPCVSLPQDAVLQEQAGPSMDPLWSHKSCQQTCFSMGSSLHGSTAPAGICSSAGNPQGHSLFQASTCSSTEPMGCRWICSPPWASRAADTHPPSSQASEEYLLCCLEHFLHWLWCLCRAASLTFSLLCSGYICPCAAAFPPFSNPLSLQHYQCPWWAQPWWAAKPTLETAGNDFIAYRENF